MALRALNHFVAFADGGYTITLSNWDAFAMRVGNSTPGAFDLSRPEVNVLETDVAPAPLNGHANALPDRDGQRDTDPHAERHRDTDSLKHSHRDSSSFEYETGSGHGHAGHSPANRDGNELSTGNAGLNRNANGGPAARRCQWRRPNQRGLFVSADRCTVCFPLSSNGRRQP